MDRGEHMTRIYHSSDLHGNWEKLFDAPDFDVWVDSGDFFDNETRGDRAIEPEFQTNSLLENGMLERIVRWLNGRPLICIPGNHDYVDLAGLVRWAGGTAWNLTSGSVEIVGVKFAGFREIPWIAGEWNGETHDFSEVIEKTFGTQPDVLVTHAPAGGILDGGSGKGYGIPALASALTWVPHTIKAHLFGHTHECGGRVENEMGVMFANGAGTARVHVI
jgi:Icc-related predicted phosphoesterase